MAGVYVPTDDVERKSGWNWKDFAPPGSNRRAFLRRFNLCTDDRPHSEVRKMDGTQQRARPHARSHASDLGSPVKNKSSSKGSTYWQWLTESARKKAWFNPFSKGDRSVEGSEAVDEKQKKDKIQFLARRNARSSCTTMQNILKRKIFVSDERAEDLRRFEMQADVEHSNLGDAASQSQSKHQQSSKADPHTETESTGRRVPVMLLGFSEEQVELIQKVIGDRYCCRAETFIERDWVTLMKTTSAEFTLEDPLRPPAQGKNGKKLKSKDDQPQIVAVRFSEPEISEFQRCCLSVHFMASRIVAPVVDVEGDTRPDVHEALGTFMHGTWPVHSNIESFCKFCMHDVPRLRRLRSIVQDDVQSKIQHLGKVNYLWHGAKRVPVSFVPFGVSAVNFLGLSRLVATILLRTGMLKDTETKKAGLLLAGQSYAKVFVLDNLGDLYQLTAAGTVVASLTRALYMGEGLALAVDSLSLTDFALLGSASVVTGAVAAIGAALTRPEMVQSLSDLIATLQTLWIVFPEVRRQGAIQPDDEATPEQCQTAVQLTELTMVDSDADTPGETFDDPGARQICEKDLDCTLKLMLREESPIVSPYNGLSGPFSSATEYIDRPVAHPRGALQGLRKR